MLHLNQLVDLQHAVNPDNDQVHCATNHDPAVACRSAKRLWSQRSGVDIWAAEAGEHCHSWSSSRLLMHHIKNKKAITIHLSDELATMIDLKRKEWGLRSRGDALEHLLGWMVETTEADE